MKPLEIYSILTTLGLIYFFWHESKVEVSSCNGLTTGQIESHLSSSYQEHQQNNQTNKHYLNINNTTATFSIKKHIICLGKPRTATTLQFNMASISYFLYLLRYDEKRISDIKIAYVQQKRSKKMKSFLRRNTTSLIKSHMSIDSMKESINEKLLNQTVIFTTATDKKEAYDVEMELSNKGFDYAFVQDMETLKEVRSSGLISDYIIGFGLSQIDKQQMVEYFERWEILRQCCGKQMSSKWRTDLYRLGKRKPRHSLCSKNDIDDIEQSFMSTDLYQLIDQYPNIRELNKPSLLDDELNGTYCSNYNHLVHTQKLNFWGVPTDRLSKNNKSKALSNEEMEDPSDDPSET